MNMLRLAQLRERHPKSRSALYRDIADGTFPEPVRIGDRAVAWPEYEVDEINRARIAGRGRDELRRLVADLMARRTAA